MSATKSEADAAIGTTAPITTAPAARATARALPRETAVRYLWAVTRLSMGWIFLWPFLDKMFGLGHETPSARAWINGGNPTKGFLSGSIGPFSSFYHDIAGAGWVVDAERYYRAMFRGSSESWNLRDVHMADTLDALVLHLERTHGQAKAVVWEHNSHIGDARATEMGPGGQVTVGQLARERHGTDALLIGMTTYSGTVTAASDWGGPAERKQVRPALAGSWEALFHEQAAPRFLLDPAELRSRRLERAIGVIYRPETERHSHYLHAHLADQFDLLLHFDETHALEPLERTSLWEAGELPETYPWGV